MKLPSIISFDKYLVRSNWRSEHGLTQFSGYQTRGKPKIHGISMSISVRTDSSGKRLVTSSLRKGGDPSSQAAFGYSEIRGEIEEGLWKNRALAWGETGIFAEFAGPGIQKKDAVTKIDRPRLFVFAAWFINGGSDLENADRYEDGDEAVSSRDTQRRTGLITCPITLARILNPSPHVEIVPWVTGDLAAEGLGEARASWVADEANRHVADFENADPYILDRFGVSARGEGIVVMPVSEAFTHASMETFAELSWKAKTSAHSVKNVSRPVTISTELPDSVAALVSAFVTPARIEQILAETFPSGDFDLTGTGIFVGAMVTDVLKESLEERASLDATDAQILQVLRRAARDAFIGMLKDAPGPEM